MILICLLQLSTTRAIIPSSNRKENMKPLPNDGEEALFLSLPDSVLKTISDTAKRYGEGMGGLMESIAKTSYVKGQLDSINETLKGSQIL